MMMRIKHILVLGLFVLTAHAKDGGEYQPSGGEYKPSEMSIETGVFEPSWQSLSANYQAPQWFQESAVCQELVLALQATY